MEYAAEVKPSVPLAEFRLRRMGQRASLPGIRDTYELANDVVTVGRSKKAEIYLDSSMDNPLISRIHARFVRNKERDSYELHDSSTNGTYVNNLRVRKSLLLKEGDAIAFGHQHGAFVLPGAYAPQSGSEFLFKFERVPIVKKEEPLLGYSESDTGFVDPTASGFDPAALKTEFVGVAAPSSTSNPISYPTDDLMDVKERLKFLPHPGDDLLDRKSSPSCRLQPSLDCKPGAEIQSTQNPRRSSSSVHNGVVVIDLESAIPVKSEHVHNESSTTLVATAITKREPMLLEPRLEDANSILMDDVKQKPLPYGSRLLPIIVAQEDDDGDDAGPKERKPLLSLTGKTGDSRSGTASKRSVVDNGSSSNDKLTDRAAGRARQRRKTKRGKGKKPRRLKVILDSDDTTSEESFNDGGNDDGDDDEFVPDCVSFPPTKRTYPKRRSSSKKFHVIEVSETASLPCQEGSAPADVIRDAAGLPSAGLSPARESLPGGDVPCESRPGDDVPCESEPGGGVPCESQPGGGVPCESEPGGDVPCESEPGGDVPCESEPGGDVPCESQPGGDVLFKEVSNLDPSQAAASLVNEGPSTFVVAPDPVGVSATKGPRAKRARAKRARAKRKVALANVCDVESVQRTPSPGDQVLLDSSSVLAPAMSSRGRRRALPTVPSTCDKISSHVDNNALCPPINSRAKRKVTSKSLGDSGTAPTVASACDEPSSHGDGNSFRPARESRAKRKVVSRTRGDIERVQMVPALAEEGLSSNGIGPDIAIASPARRSRSRAKQRAMWSKVYEIRSERAVTSPSDEILSQVDIVPTPGRESPTKRSRARRKFAVKERCGNETSLVGPCLGDEPCPNIDFVPDGASISSVKEAPATRDVDSSERCGVAALHPAPSTREGDSSDVSFREKLRPSRAEKGLGESASRRKRCVRETSPCPAKYCCRPVGSRKLNWVQCEDCLRWIHVSCSGLAIKEVRKKSTKFRCGCKT